MHQQSIDTTCRLLAVAVEWWRFQEQSLHQSPFVLINTSGHTALHLSCECFPSLNVSSFLYLFLCHQPMDTSFFFVFLVRMLAQREPESDYVQLCSRPWWTQVRHSVVDWVQAIRSITLQLAGAYSFLPCPLSAFHYKEALHKWLKERQQLLIPHTAMTCVKLQLDWFGNPNQWNYLIWGEQHSTVLSGHNSSSAVSFSQQLFDLLKPACVYWTTDDMGESLTRSGC